MSWVGENKTPRKLCLCSNVQKMCVTEKTTCACPAIAECSYISGKLSRSFCFAAYSSSYRTMTESCCMCGHGTEFLQHVCLRPAVVLLYRSELRCGHSGTDTARRASAAATSSSAVSGILAKHKSTETESETLVMLCRTERFFFSGSRESNLRWKVLPELPAHLMFPNI